VKIFELPVPQPGKEFAEHNFLGFLIGMKAIGSQTTLPTPALRHAASETMNRSRCWAHHVAMPTSHQRGDGDTWTAPAVGSNVSGRAAADAVTDVSRWHRRSFAELLHPHARERRNDHCRRRLRMLARARFHTLYPAARLQVLRQEEQRPEQERNTSAIAPLAAAEAGS